MMRLLLLVLVLAAPVDAFADLMDRDPAYDRLGRKLAEQGVHVIFASGYDRSNFSGQVEGFDYIEKPLDPSSLKRCCPILEDQVSA